MCQEVGALSLFRNVGTQLVEVDDDVKAQSSNAETKPDGKVRMICQISQRPEKSSDG